MVAKLRDIVLDNATELNSPAYIRKTKMLKACSVN